MSERNKYLDTFIDETNIHQLIESSLKPDDKLINDILQKANELHGLDQHEIASLLNIENQDHLDALFHTALSIKENIYGNRLVLFAPLYISNYCTNNCLYCAYRHDNKSIHRITLSKEQIETETRTILEQGHKRILILMGEDYQNFSLDNFIDSIETVYNVKDSKGSYIRRINVEINPLSDEEFQRLGQVKIGTYTVFQETYHRETYKHMHPKGPKSNYEWRLNTMERALRNGIHDVGIGALFGLFDYKFEVLSMISHSEYLDKMFNVGPHTISIPRIQKAPNTPYTGHIQHGVSDMEFKKLVAVLRCAVPYTGMILSTRETAQLRTELFDLGISQISAGSKTNPGGYKKFIDQRNDDSQFFLNDNRSSGEVIHDVIEHGFLPSFCTGCYRLGRVGQDFMDLAKPGLIKLNCLPNGILTLKEYLEDYAAEETKKIGNEMIEAEIKNIPSKVRMEETRKNLIRIENGERDLYF